VARERLRALLRGDAVDRLPVAAWRHFPQDDQAPAELAASVVADQRSWDWDFVKVTPSQTFLAEVWGVEGAYTGNSMGIRDFVHRPVASLADWGKVQAADGPTRQRVISDYSRSIALVREALGAEAVILGTVFSPLSVARYLCGDELFTPSVRLARQALDRYLANATEVVCELVTEVLSAGADGCFVSLFSAGAGPFSEAEYTDVALASDTAVFESAAAGWFNIAHFHSPYPFLGLCDRYAVQAVSWDLHDGGPSVLEAHDLCGDKVLVGGVDQRGWLLALTADQVGMRVRDLVDGVEAGASRPGLRLVVAPGCTVPQTTPLGNLRAMRRAVG
jgi:uroporphyrinogen decarboxylase